jgi:hypothetical protein
MLSYKSGERKAELTGGVWNRMFQVLSGGGSLLSFVALIGPVAQGGVPWIVAEAPAAVAVVGAACYGVRCLRKRLAERAENRGVWDAFMDRLSIYGSAFTGETRTAAKLMEACQSLLLGS